VDPNELELRRRVAHEEAYRLKQAVPRITLLNEPLRHHEGDGSLPAESAGEPGLDGRGTQPDPEPRTEAER
jgi:hypothetical protein